MLICIFSAQTAPPPFIKDWYGLYKQRVMMDSPAKVMVVDLGSFSCKCAVVDRVKSHIKTATIESVVALVSWCGWEEGGSLLQHNINIVVHTCVYSLIR